MYVSLTHALGAPIVAAVESPQQIYKSNTPISLSLLCANPNFFVMRVWDQILANSTNG